MKSCPLCRFWLQESGFWVPTTSVHDISPLFWRSTVNMSVEWLESASGRSPKIEWFRRQGVVLARSVVTYMLVRSRFHALHEQCLEPGSASMHHPGLATAPGYWRNPAGAIEAYCSFEHSLHQMRRWTADGRYIRPKEHRGGAGRETRISYCQWMGWALSRLPWSKSRVC